MLARIKCFFTHHTPIKNVLGGFRCLTCGKPGENLEDFGFDYGYVEVNRNTYGRVGKSLVKQ